MTNRSIVFMLPDETNPYTKLVVSDAIAAARRLSFSIEPRYCGIDAMRQIHDLYQCINREKDERPCALCVMPARNGALARIARDALHAGIAWVLLNRRASMLQEFDVGHAVAPMFAVGIDDTEIGRLQGKQFRRLLPEGGVVISVEGSIDSQTACDRTEGTRQSLAGTRIELLTRINGGWTENGAAAAFRDWMQMAAPTKHVDIVGCQNDAMAQGVIRAVSNLIGVPQLERTLVTGCDGLPECGMRLVRDGKMKATIVVPSTGGPAVEALARAFDGEMPRGGEVVLPVRSWPELESLAP
jgi:ABC-type sugar transport system substrate-binding protein